MPRLLKVLLVLSIVTLAAVMVFLAVSIGGLTWLASSAEDEFVQLEWYVGSWPAVVQAALSFITLIGVVYALVRRRAWSREAIVLLCILVCGTLAVSWFSAGAWWWLPATAALVTVTAAIAASLYRGDEAVAYYAGLRRQHPGSSQGAT